MVNQASASVSYALFITPFRVDTAPQKKPAGLTACGLGMVQCLPPRRSCYLGQCLRLRQTRGILACL